MTDNFSIVRPRESYPAFDTVVAMAVYAGDKPQWVEQAVESILKQSYTDYLFVIVIDGPICDQVHLKLNQYLASSERLVLVKGAQNTGLANCMNFAIDWALQYQPVYFVRMDADDISSGDRLARQITFLQANPEIAILGSALEEIDESGNVVGSRMLPLSHSEIVNFLPKRCSVNHPTVAIRYSVFSQGFRYRAELRNIEDYYLWAELAANGLHFANLKDKLLKFRRANDFYVRRGFSKSINEFKARLFAMRVLSKQTPLNYLYAVAVLILRWMPTKIIKLAYKLDRLILEKIVKH